VFTDGDRQSPDRVVIINEAMARSLWPGQSAIGKHLGDPRGDPARPPQWATVVGVVSDARFVATLTAPVSAYQIYDVIRSPSNAMVLLRTRGAPEAAAGDLRRVLAGIDSEASVDEVLSARALANRALGNFSLLAWTLFAFATLGLVLSALGVYGLFAGYVAQHTREIGVRMALGAQAVQVQRMVLGKGLRLALLGGVLGVAGAMAVVPLLRSVAAELPARDPTAIVVLAMSLIAVALFACWLPARRAAGLDPMVALRSE
jgi:predicted lysophospholipase L1 biosynthesis ABC-type transport system permease subunit